MDFMRERFPQLPRTQAFAWKQDRLGAPPRGIPKSRKTYFFGGFSGAGGATGDATAFWLATSVAGTLKSLPV